MPPFPFVALFCEDIRQETAGSHTLVGVLPDNVNIGPVPGMISKFAVFIRIQLDLDVKPTTLRARMKIPGGKTFELANFESQMELAQAQAKSSGLPFAGLIATGVFSPLPITAVGKIEAFVEVDGAEYICGALNLLQPPTPTQVSTASPPPA
jgi:hypothetical protein